MLVDPSSFSHKMCVRICGLLVEEDSILLTQIHSPVFDELVWIPPGGGLQYGENMHTCLKREFQEETNLDVEVKGLVHVNELVEPPFHALEFYFEVQKVSGELKLGRDPELSDENQLLNDLQWVSIDQLTDVLFAPQNLLEKIREWDNRYNFEVFTKA